MFSLQKGSNLEVQGNVGNDPEMRFTPNGKPVTTFSVAFKDDFDEKGNRAGTQWMRVVAWNELAEIVNKTLKKGNFVNVKGFLEHKRVEIGNGAKEPSVAYFTSLIARKIKIYDGEGEFVNIEGEKVVV